MRVSLWWHSSRGARVLALLVSTVQSVAAARPVDGEHAISHAIHRWVFQDLNRGRWYFAVFAASWNVTPRNCMRNVGEAADGDDERGSTRCRHLGP